MSCGCKGGRPGKYVDISCTKLRPWDEVPALLGITVCGDPVPVDKPLFELSAEDREKLDTILLDGPSDEVLFADGVYRTVSGGSSVLPSDTNPLVDGVVSPGVSTQYSRGDHRHPTDTTRAAASDLAAYFPLAGNSRANRITGDVYLTSGRKVRLTNSGNSTLGQSDTSTAIELVGSGVDGIDIIAMNGTVRANGEQVVTYDSNSDIRALNDIYLGNDKNLFGIGFDGAVHNLIEKSRFGIIDAGSTGVPFNISSSIRPTVQLADETGAEAHEVAFVSDIDSLMVTVQSDIDALDLRITNNTNAISGNTSDIQSILSRLGDQENFRGYKLTTTDVTDIVNPESGNFAYNIQTGTIWVYNGTTWADSLEPIPDGAIQAYDSDPLMDETASAGASQLYSRGDHRHPSDSTKANAATVVEIDNRLTRLSGDFEGYVTSNDEAVQAVETATTTNTGNISTLTTRMTTAEGNIDTLQTQANTIGTDVNNLTTRVSEAEAKIAALEGILSNVTGFWAGTQAQYDAISPKVPNTYYHIYED